MNSNTAHGRAPLQTLKKTSLLGAVATLALSFALTSSITPPQAVADSNDPWEPLPPRSRILVVNDIAGDVDGVFATIHALSSSSTEVVGFVGNGVGAQGTGEAALATEKGREVLEVMDISDVWVAEGSPTAMSDPLTPQDSPGARAIIAEANRTDTNLPLIVTVGSGLTDVASALLLDPSIARKMTLVWIGGAPYPQGGGEANLNSDVAAAQMVFNHSDVPLWQIPTTAYWGMQVSFAEIKANLDKSGKVGSWLWNELISDWEELYGTPYGPRIGGSETWMLGDNPLVTVTALTHWNNPTGTRSSSYEELPRPQINDDGSYTLTESNENIRAYTGIDVRMTLSDMWGQLQLRYGESSPTPTVTVTATPPAATPPATTGEDLYVIPGLHRSAGRNWMTVCEDYSTGVDRCWTYIWGTTVQQLGSQFVQTNGWNFNNLTYVGGSRTAWAANPLGHTGSWTGDDGREWRTECDTAVSGRNGCRTYANADVLQRVGNSYQWVNKEVFNNQVRFG